MNEDDTFNALKRVPYLEMKRRISDLFFTKRVIDSVAVFENTGWTKEEFFEYRKQEGLKYINTLRHFSN